MKYILVCLILNLAIPHTAKSQLKNGGLDSSYNWTKKRQVVKFLKNQMDSIKKIISKKFDLKDPTGERVTIKYKDLEGKTMGFYSRGDKRITVSKKFFNDFFTKLEIDNIDQEETWLDLLVGTIAHEVGHYVTELVAEKINDESLWDDYEDSTDLGSHMIMEGIGHYFKYLVIKEPFYYSYFKFSKEFWSEADLTSTDDTKRSRIAYIFGYFLVKPVIDEFGIEGIKYLLQNKLKVDPPNLKQAEEYQIKALEYLRSQKKNVYYNPAQRDGIILYLILRFL